MLTLNLSMLGDRYLGSVFRYYRKWILSTDYLNTDLFKKILNLLPEVIPPTFGSRYFKKFCFNFWKNFLAFLWLLKICFSFFSTGSKIPTINYLLLTFWKFYRLLATESWWEKIPATEYQPKFLVLGPALEFIIYAPKTFFGPSTTFLRILAANESNCLIQWKNVSNWSVTWFPLLLFFCLCLKVMNVYSSI